jgi:hypothetical protein
MRENDLKKISRTAIIILSALLIASCLASCDAHISDPIKSLQPSETETDSDKPSEAITDPLTPETEVFDYIIQYQNSIPVSPLEYDTTQVELSCDDGFSISVPVVTIDSGMYPVYESGSNSSLNTAFISIPDSNHRKYIVWNMHKIYVADFYQASLTALLPEDDGNITYDQALNTNDANGLYWGTKPILSFDGRYLLYLTNRRDNGKTNDMRLYEMDTGEDQLLLKDTYYTDAYISDSTVFFTCNNKLMRIEISSKVLGTVSNDISVNGSFSYPYYIYTKEYCHTYNIINILSLGVTEGTAGTSSSALCIGTNTYNNICAITLLDKTDVSVLFLDLSSNGTVKTCSIDTPFRVIYRQWIDGNRFLVSGYEEATGNEKTYIFTY